jgi:tetratricopeptide (TPR) repeat protein
MNTGYKIGELALTAYQWVATWYLPIFTFFIGCLAVWFYYRVRKSIVVGVWVNRAKDMPPDIGKSLADLLLHKIRAIQSIHEKSIRKVGLWNPYFDIPAFQQSLDEDIKLLASVELGNYGAIISRLVTFLFKLTPLFFQPAEIRGSIHNYGKDIIFQVVLGNYRLQETKGKIMRVWEVKGNIYEPEKFPDLLDELAYQIYLELVGSDLIKSWKCFRAFALGLRHYISYTDIPNDFDFAVAEKYYREAIEIEPNNPASPYNLGVLKYFRYEHDENQEAIELFNKALRSSNKTLRGHAHSALASALCQRYGRFRAGNIDTLREAKFHAEQAIKISPKTDAANKAMAYAYHQYSDMEGLEKSEAEQNRDLAIKYYKKAFRRNPRHYIAYNNLGNLYLEWADNLAQGRQREGLLNKAISYCEEAISIQPSYQHAYDNIGNAYLALGKLEKAEENYRVALIYSPDYAEAKNDLAMLYLLKEFPGKNVNEALRLHFESISKVNPERRAKLCKAFQKRLDKLRHDVSNFIATANIDSQHFAQVACTCLEPPQQENPQL